MSILLSEFHLLLINLLLREGVCGGVGKLRAVTTPIGSNCVALNLFLAIDLLLGCLKSVG